MSRQIAAMSEHRRSGRLLVPKGTQCHMVSRVKREDSLHMLKLDERQDTGGSEVN